MSLTIRSVTRMFCWCLMLFVAMLSGSAEVAPQWSADFSSAEAFAKCLTVSGYTFPPSTKLTSPLPATFQDGKRQLTSTASTFWEELRPTQPIFDKMTVGNTYIFEATVTQPPSMVCMSRLNVVFGKDSTLSGKPMRRFDAGQLVDNAVCFGQSGEKIRAMTDWDIPNLPYSA
ncbi:MAG TPA: hypothetical protein VHV83_12990, partial [Armatimonadota bacterium]|nr:hypothetical protein [Armatimonadota bacterium]